MRVILMSAVQGPPISTKTLSNGSIALVVALDGSLRAVKGNQQTTITSSTSETTIVTADATNFLDLYGLILTNSSATGTKVTIKDATAGTTRIVFWCPANDTRGFMLPGADAHKQAAVNNNWTCTCGTSVASLDVTALFIKNV